MSPGVDFRINCYVIKDVNKEPLGSGVLMENPNLSLCKKLRNGSLTSTPGAAEKIGMPYSVVNNLISQCLDNGILPFYFIKITRTPLPV